jgi:hypothetical protein
VCCLACKAISSGEPVIRIDKSEVASSSQVYIIKNIHYLHIEKAGHYSLLPSELAWLTDRRAARRIRSNKVAGW